MAFLFLFLLYPYLFILVKVHGSGEESLKNQCVTLHASFYLEVNI